MKKVYTYIKEYRDKIVPPYKKKDISVVVISVLFLAVLIITPIIVSQKSDLFSHAASANTVLPASGVLTGNATVVSDSNVSGGQYVQLGSVAAPTPMPTSAPTPTPLSSSITSTPMPTVPIANSSCSNPVYQGAWPTVQYPGWADSNGVEVDGDIQTGGTASDSMQLNVCSTSSWNVLSNFARNNGAINAYPDTMFTLSGDKTVTQYSSLQTCFGEQEPTPVGPQFPTSGGSEWDYAYDVWLNNHTGEDVWANDIEIMVWNDWTDTSYYPPAGSRAVTIDGIAYHMFKGGGANEWIYTRDARTTSGCFDMLSIIKDLANNGSSTTVDYQGTPGMKLSTSGMTLNAALQHVEYGVEISATYGTQTFQITNATLTVK